MAQLLTREERRRLDHQLTEIVSGRSPQWDSPADKRLSSILDRLRSADHAERLGNDPLDDFDRYFNHWEPLSPDERSALEAEAVRLRASGATGRDHYAHAHKLLGQHQEVRFELEDLLGDLPDQVALLRDGGTSAELEQAQCAAMMAGDAFECLERAGLWRLDSGSFVVRSSPLGVLPLKAAKMIPMATELLFRMLDSAIENARQAEATLEEAGWRWNAESRWRITRSEESSGRVMLGAYFEKQTTVDPVIRSKRRGRPRKALTEAVQLIGDHWCLHTNDDATRRLLAVALEYHPALSRYSGAQIPTGRRSSLYNALRKYLDDLPRAVIRKRQRAEQALEESRS